MCLYLVCPFYNFEIDSFLKCFDFGTFNLKQYSIFLNKPHYSFTNSDVTGRKT